MKRFIALLVAIQTFFSSINFSVVSDMWDDFTDALHKIDFSWVDTTVKRIFRIPSPENPTFVNVSDLTSEMGQDETSMVQNPTTTVTETTMEESTTGSYEPSTTVPAVTEAPTTTKPATTAAPTTTVPCPTATTAPATTVAPTTTVPYVPPTTTTVPTTIPTTVPTTVHTTVPTTVQESTTIGNADPNTCTHSWIILNKTILKKYPLMQQVKANEVCQYCGTKRGHTFEEIAYDAQANIETEEAIIIQRVNELRAKKGLNTLEPATSFFDDWCNMRAQELEINFAHVRPNGDSCGIIHDGYHAFGENIACGYNSGEAIYNGFYNSTPHRTTMLNSSATHISVAIYIGSNGKTYCCMQLIGPR